MTKTKSTKRALLASVMALFLCFAMLLGTTYAWFTDSVTSGNNIIKSGTLDVEMYWAYGTEAPDSATWTDASTGAIFNYDKWEPGYTEVRHIQIANKGSLALKYQLKIIANGEVSKLADVIDVYYVDPAIQVANRTDLTDANKLGTLNQVLGKLGETGNGELTKGASDTITIAFKMQETAGNEYQNLAIGTDFSVQLLATQLTYEEDSFDKQYDKDALYPVISAPVDIPEDSTEAKDQTFTTDDSTVNAPAEVMKDIADNTSAKRAFIEHAEPIIENNKVIFGYFDLVDENKNVIDLEKMGNTTPLTVTVDLNGAFANGETVVVYHDGEAIASAVVTDGKITYTTTHFCEIVVAYNDGKINSGVELEAAISNGGTVELEGNVVLTETIEIPADVTVVMELNGYTITSEKSNVIKNYGTLTITNGVLDATTAYTVNNAGGNVTIKNVKSVDAGFYNAGTMLVEDCEITNTISGRHGLYNNANATLVINGLVCSTTSQNAIIYNNNGKVTVNDGAFTQIGSSYMLDGSNITINGGTFTDDDGTWAIRGNGHVIKGGTFNFNPNKYVAPDYKVIDNGDGTFTVGPDRISVATAAELSEALAQGGKIILTADITATETIAVSQDVEAILDLGGYTLTGQVYKLLELKDGKVTIQNGTIRNVHEAATDTKYSIYMSGDAAAQIKDVTIETTGTGIYMGGNSKITELNANIKSYHNANGYCAFSGISLVDNARIDVISGGNYSNYIAPEFIAGYPQKPSFSALMSYTIELNGDNASIGEIKGGTFLGEMDKANNGAVLWVNAGTVEKISGGYFGFVKHGLNNPYKLLFVNSGTNAAINKIVGGTFEKGTSPTGFGCDFASIVDNSGCQVVDLGKTETVSAQFSTSVKTYTVKVVEVSAK